MTNTRKVRSVICVIVAAMVMATGCSKGASSSSVASSASQQPEQASASVAEKLPADKLDYVVAAAAGGGLDIVSRCFSDQWASELGTTLEYIYEDAGSSYAMGLNDLNDDDEDEYSVMCGLAESLPAMFSFQKSDYSMADIAWIGNIYSDANCVMVRADDDRFQSMADVIKYARETSAPLTISTPQALTPANMTASIFVKNAGLNANIVVYEGGSAARKDLLGGQVDISIGGITTAVSIKDQVRVIGVFGTRNSMSDFWPDAQTLDQFATDFTMPDMTVHCSVWTSAKLKNEHPETYQLLVKTFKTAMESADAGTNFKNASQLPFIDYLTPDELQNALDTFNQVLVDNNELLNPKNG